MIDFRYHLVSLIAVFLALSVGILIGSTAFKPAVEGGLNAAVNQARHHESKLEQQNTQLQQQINADQRFASAASERLLGGLLSGQSVVVVAAAGADGSTISGIEDALRQSGATVTGEVSLSSQFLDTSAKGERSLTALARQLSPVGMTFSAATQGQQVLGQQDAAQVIATAVVSKDPPASGSQGLTDQAILNGFAQQGYLQLSPSNGSTVIQPASLAVLVIPASPASSSIGPASLALVAVAQQLQVGSRGTVMAGSLTGSGSGSAIEAVTSGAAQISTIDNADTEVGQVMVAQALARALAGRKPASYGVASGAAPSPAPTPASTSSPSPTPTSTSSSKPSRGTSPGTK